MLCVLILAGGAEWESPALDALNDSRELVVLKRCVDGADLMASATTGQADIAILALEDHGVDLSVVEHLRRHQLCVIGIAASDAEGTARARKLGLSAHLGADQMDQLVGVCVSASRSKPSGDGLDQSEGAGPRDEVAIAGSAGTPGRIIACWGAYGSPGRTMVAIGVAAELARRRVRTTLVDADPWGGAIAQHLGVLDEVSGLLAAARWSAAGELQDRINSVQREVGDMLSVVTGLPRPDRWMEVRSGTVENLCELTQVDGHVVLDTGFSIEEAVPGPADFGTRAGRNEMTLAGLRIADELLVVASADPVGLSRLARALVDLQDIATKGRIRVVINRMRASLGWSETEIAGMVQEFARVTSISFLPEDRGCVDQAMLTGSTLSDGPLRRGLTHVVDELFPELSGPGQLHRFRKRTRGTVRRR